MSPIDKSGHIWSNEAMARVKIAQLKSHLCGYLRQVRNGAEIVVTDRENPIARLLPFRVAADKLTISPAKKSPQQLKNLKIPAAPAGTNSLRALLEDRDE